MGLDVSLYGNVRSQKLALDLLPTLNRAYHVILQEERLRVIVPAIEESPDILAYVVKYDTYSSSKPDWRDIREREKSKKKKLYCTHYSTRGHDVTSCFIKNQNFPDWWGDRPRTVVEARARSASTAPRGSTVRANSILPGPTSVSNRIPDDRLIKRTLLPRGRLESVSYTMDFTCFMML
ncbi:hypothetical protein RND81_13G039000 [Saponaria officinalis]|uniref:Uncharacterized protein n=1 Tax=Saponaria officinalis TaxID=3572 RepID=A0AAW1GVU5_SAPOF